MDLDLIDHRRDARMVHQLFEVMRHEVAYPDRPDAAFIVEPFERAPGVEPQPPHWPVQEEKVNEAKSKRGAALVKSGERAVETMIRVPQFGCHEQFFSRDPALSHRATDVGLVVVEPRRVDMAIA